MELSERRQAIPFVDDADEPSEEAAPPRTPGGPRLAAGLLRSARPKQWPKNLLVFAAPGAAGVLTQGPVLARTVLAFLSFCLAASGTYFFNDVRDIEADRRHPVKLHRPIAAGTVPIPLCLATGALLVLGGLALAAVVGWRFLVVLVLYLCLTGAYSLGLKDVAVVDLAVIASGFIIRAAAGGAAAGVPISQWFLIVASFGSLFMVSGKRHGEHLDLDDDRASVRPTLGIYPVGYLRYVWMLSSGVAVTAYCLWAFEQAQASVAFPWYELTIVPFVLAILRYALLLELGRGGAPEEIVLRDRPLQVLGVLWIVIFACAVYLGR